MRRPPFVVRDMTRRLQSILFLFILFESIKSLFSLLLFYAYVATEMVASGEHV